MEKVTKLFIVCCLFALSSMGAATSKVGKEITNSIGVEHELESKILNETRRYLVHLPASYQDAEKNYPVIYLLDGDGHFQHAVSAMKTLQNFDRMPESILIGIPNNPGTRFRDLSQNENNFLQFIEKELIPLVESNYRTIDHKTLFGHSLAGFFTLNTLAENSDSFDSFIAASPHLLVNKGEVKSKLETLFKTEKVIEKIVYFSMADSKGDGNARVDDINQLVDFIQGNAPKSLTWKFEPMLEQTHMTTPYLTIFKGLSFVFSDYQMPRYSSVKEFERQGGMTAVEMFYQARGKKYGIDNQVDSTMIGLLAKVYINEKRSDEALQLLQSHVASNSKSMRAHFNLAEFFYDKGDKILSVKSYKTAKALLPLDNEGFHNYISGQIKELEE